MQVRDGLIALPVIGALIACGYGSSDRHMDEDMHDDGAAGGSDDDATGIPESRIDTDATLTDISPGEGAGVFVEYQTGGTWRIRTSCDTRVSGASCVWDIIVTPINGTVNTFVGEELESSDWLGRERFDGVRLISFTDFSIDGVSIQATESVPVRLDVYLDGQPANRYIYWVGDGGLHRGAPDNPIDLLPTAP
jgi:hypothetical protein